MLSQLSMDEMTAEQAKMAPVWAGGVVVVALAAPLLGVDEVDDVAVELLPAVVEVDGDAAPPALANLVQAPRTVELYRLPRLGSAVFRCS